MEEMKAGSAFRDLLACSPVEFDRSRGLKFKDKPNYLFLRQLFSQILVTEGWTENARFDWEDGSAQKGVLLRCVHATNSHIVNSTFISRSFTSTRPQEHTYRSVRSTNRLRHIRAIMHILDEVRYDQPNS